ncbi:MAG: hypothetical protein ACFFG0_03925 [Candidatus Thorarchaeota archaeon]
MKECKGCNMKGNGTYMCRIYELEHLVSLCPCLNCLLKAICEIQCAERMILFAINSENIAQNKFVKKWEFKK